jgi:hypothetical protein
MLAEIFILRIEGALRNAERQTWPSSDMRFVPIKLAVGRMTNRTHAELQERFSAPFGE